MSIIGPKEIISMCV